MATNFEWKIGQPLPGFEPHSDKKLTVVEDYLESYFDTVAPSPRQDKLRISIVDAFCGGGAYLHGDARRAGSPLVTLQAVENAKRRLNVGRSKPLEILPAFYFSDINPDHVDHLRQILIAEGYGTEIDRTIFLSVSSADDAVRRVVPLIAGRQTAGRSIFLLDQCGWSQVAMSSVIQIFRQLKKAEVLLTFSIDALLNYLEGDAASSHENAQQFGIDAAFLADWKDWKRDPKTGRRTGQRFVMETIRKRSGARFFTPFMLYSSTDHRWMTFAHLSQSQTARDKMLSVHWNKQNNFRHIGSGSLFELGFDQRLIEASSSLFTFQDSDRLQMTRELMEELPRLIRPSLEVSPLAVSSFINQIANQTAATNADIKTTLQTLSSEGEFEVMRKDGGLRRPGSAVRLDDQLVLNSQPRFRFF